MPRSSSAKQTPDCGTAGNQLMKSNDNYGKDNYQKSLNVNVPWRLSNSWRGNVGFYSYFFLLIVNNALETL